MPAIRLRLPTIYPLSLRNSSWMERSSCRWEVVPLPKQGLMKGESIIHPRISNQKQLQEASNWRYCHLSCAMQTQSNSPHTYQLQSKHQQGMAQPLTKTQFSSSSSQTPPPTPPSPSTPPSQPQSPAPSQQLSTSSSNQQAPVSVNVQQEFKPSKPKPATADSTDWIASTLTRRFGLGAGLAWAAFLAVGVISEQIKTRIEVSQQEANTRNVEKEEEVVLPNGIRYYELRVGGGASPRPGDLVVIDLKGKIEGNGEVFVDTFGGEKKPLALVMGSRPYSRGMCEGIEYVLRSMKAGGKRRVIIPPTLGFGEKGTDLGPGVQIPPFATLEYIVEVEKVSIAPA